MKLGYFFLFVVVVVLYGPFVENPVVFDDHNIVTNLSVYSYALEPFSRYSRTFPYFTIGLVHVLSGGDLAWNRALSLVLHAVVVLALYFFLRRATSSVAAINDRAREGVCWFVSLWMAINPVAVYGVGYLTQRTILFATLFSLLSVLLYLRAQQQSRSVDVVSAALMASAAMMSKEHAVLLPLAVVALTPLVAIWHRQVVLRALGYLVLSVPCVLWVLLHKGSHYIGSAYEASSGEILSQLGEARVSEHFGSDWLMSIATQLLMFWKYLFLWFFPNPTWMSADMRIDFPELWDGVWAYAGLVLTVLLLLGALVCWIDPRRRVAVRRWASVAGFVAIPFVVELSAVRVQEPFVLYRSYLWMPGYAVLLAMLLMTVDEKLVCLTFSWPRKVFWGGALLASAALFPLAQDRLRSFSSEEALWLDALVKLPRPDVVGADRIYYNLAGESQKRKDFEAALEWSKRAIACNPNAFQGYLIKARALSAMKQYDDAMQAFDVALTFRPPELIVGVIEFERCGIMEAVGEREAAVACLRRSAKMGYEMARFRLQMKGIYD